MLAREIKDLAIAMEALSRIPGIMADNSKDEIQNILDRKVKQLKEETSLLPPIRPTAHAQAPDDEIPY